MGLLVITGCNDESQEKTFKKIVKATTNVENNPMQYYADALEKAKDIEGMIQDASDKRFKAIEGIIE